jgi:4-diphosphocytidyl-2-C-methyl-D-erythritol kinase
MNTVRAYAKVNLALVVGPARSDSRHEVVTLLQRIDLHDDVTLDASDELVVEGFPADTIVRSALESLAGAAHVDPRWRVRIEKRIPVAAGLGGGSTDAAAALRLANATLAVPLPDEDLHHLAAGVGADVPFFLGGGTQLATGDGTQLQPVELPLDYHVVLVVPHGVTKGSTGAVYERFDARAGEVGFAERADALLAALRAIGSAREIARLPANDLASSPIAPDLAASGAFRADVSGAGPTVYGLYEREGDAARAASTFAHRGATLATRPVAAEGSPRVAR